MSSAIPISQIYRQRGADKQSGEALGWLWLLGLLLLGHLPLLVRFFSEQWGRPQYQFYPLMLLAAAYVAWQRLVELDSASIVAGSKWASRSLLGASLALLIAAFLLWSGRGAAIAMWIALASLAWQYGGWTVARALAPSGLLLALTIGPPLGFEDTLLQDMRALAVWLGGTVLLWLGVPHLTTGTVIEIVGRRLLVAEACSGINSLMAVLGFTLVLGFLKHHNGRRIAALLLFATFFALLANVGRITLGVWLEAAKGIDILSGTIHEWTSIIIFCICMALVFSADALISLVWMLLRQRGGGTAEREPRKIQPEAPSRRHLPPFTVTRGMWYVAVAFALLGIVQIGNAAMRGGLTVWFASPFTPHLPIGTAVSLPEELAGWKRSEAQEKYLAQPEIEGKRSQAWVYTRDATTAIVAMDFPFAGFHDLMICYQNAGWTVSEKVVKAQVLPQGDAPYIAARVDRLKEHGYSWFGAVNERGVWVQPPSPTRAGRLQQRLEHLGQPDWNAASYQVQVWVQVYEPLSDQQRQELESLYLAARSELATQLLQKLQGGR